MVFENDRTVTANAEPFDGMRKTRSLRKHLLSASVVVSLTVCGVFLPVTVFSPGMKGYVSEASIKVTASSGDQDKLHRRIVRLREDIFSPVTLSLVVSELQLQPSDLTGVDDPGRFGVLMDLLAGGGAQTSGLVGATEAALKKSISIASNPEHDEISLGVTAATPEVSQRIADHIAGRVIKDIGTAAPQLQALEESRKALDSAEAALTGFQMRHGNDAVSLIQGLQHRIREAEQNGASLRHQNEELKDAIAAASAMKADDVLNGALPSLTAFATLEPVRQTYNTAKLSLADVSVDHGPKHPRTVAVQGALDAARATAMPTLRRVLATLKQQQETVNASLETHENEFAELEKQLTAMGAAPADFTRLETALEKARRDYLIASETAGTFVTTPAVSATLMQKAEPGVANYDGFLANIMAIAGGAVGLLAGLFLLSFRRASPMTETEDEYPEVMMPDVTQMDEKAMEDAVADIIEIQPGIFDDLETTTESVDALAQTVEVAEESDETVRGAPANDVPLDERVRQVLLRNAVPLEAVRTEPPVFRLPPLLEAALAGHAHHAQAETEELKALRQQLAALREQLYEEAAREEDNRSRA